MRKLQSLPKRYFSQSFTFKTIFTSTVTSVVTLAFALYNGVIGHMKHTEWNIAICVYYLLLCTLRAYIVLNERKLQKLSPEERDRHLVPDVHSSFITLIVLNGVLVAPIILMIRNLRPIHATLVFAIAIAAFTTYKIVIAIINFRRATKQKKILIHELRTINLVDALVSILLLQNTLITVAAEPHDALLGLSAYTSAVILGLITTIIVLSYRRAILMIREVKNKEESAENR